MSFGHSLLSTKDFTTGRDIQDRLFYYLPEENIRTHHIRFHTITTDEINFNNISSVISSSDERNPIG